ncbi:MoaD/ThiS family protein [Pseudozobellia thermophila]|uniref:Molybdopterin synthase sulfur carrier subunit n=1 Tax=Pseudozobellia thermophila TaxID=192903 RepID=A0A1M6J317_9FLAO|nr:MoaD/ThiS family protein [Pseudozobellia thermophila]SHJ41104.1 molybdopterin synthase sulfur carrier subunit [Pseudozobellia thermophila]
MEVLLFGIAKDIVGKPSFRFEGEDAPPSSVSELKKRMKAAFPELERLSSLAVAVNSEYAEDGQSLKQGDEIALIPPVSGG